MKFNLGKTCEFLLNDTIIPPSNLHKKALPGINHTLAIKYANALDLILDFSESTVKPSCVLYHKLLSSTLKHFLHKYNRTLNRSQYKTWAVVDFHSHDMKLVKYVEYPLIEDLFALQKECDARTPIPKTKDEKLEKSLDNISYAAMVEYFTYSSKQFYEDFLITYDHWIHVLNYIRNTNNLV